MTKSRSLITQYLIYLAVRLAVCLVQALSANQARKLAAGLAWLAYRLDRRHRLVADDNLRQAFPGKFSDAERDQMVRGVYRHFCTVVIEIAQLPRKLHTGNWKQHVDLIGGPPMLDLLVSGRPFMVVTGHFGNWELGGYVLGLVGFRTHAVARPLDNPFLDDFLRRFRERTGQKLLTKKGDFEQMQVLLDNGGAIATLADQDAGLRGLFVDFFGRPASTHKAIALMALEHQVPLIVVGTYKVREPMFYNSLINEVILPEAYKNHPDPVRAITQHFTSSLERLVQLAPEQYFWLHRRWKHQPAKARRKAAA